MGWRKAGSGDIGRNHGSLVDANLLVRRAVGGWGKETFSIVGVVRMGLGGSICTRPANKRVI